MIRRLCFCGGKCQEMGPRTHARHVGATSSLRLRTRLSPTRDRNPAAFRGSVSSRSQLYSTERECPWFRRPSSPSRALRHPRAPASTQPPCRYLTVGYCRSASCLFFVSELAGADLHDVRYIRDCSTCGRFCGGRANQL